MRGCNVCCNGGRQSDCATAPPARIFVKDREAKFRTTEMDRPENSVGQKRRGRPFNPRGIDPVVSFRMDYHLGKDLKHWRSLRPKPPSRSRAIRVLLRRALSAEKERQEARQQIPVQGAG
jgi:hypothetical protein